MSIVDSFDAQSSAVFSPCDVYRPLEGFPEIALIAFNRRMVDFAAGQPGAREITKLHYAVYEIPVYALKWQGRDIAVCVSFEGSGGAAMVMEELIALGARTFLAIGSCGCLDAGIAEGHLIVPTAAYRDEGASYHYVAASDFLDVPSADGLTRALDEMGLKYTRTRTWTTDAPYRETRENVRRRAGQGCGVVEMECAGLAAVAQFRQVKFAQVFYGADSLAGAEWDTRTLGAMPDNDTDRLVIVALDAAVRL